MVPSFRAVIVCSATSVVSWAHAESSCAYLEAIPSVAIVIQGFLFSLCCQFLWNLSDLCNSSALLLTLVRSANLFKRVRQEKGLMDTGFSHITLKNQALKTHYGQGKILIGSLKIKNWVALKAPQTCSKISHDFVGKIHYIFPGSAANLYKPYVFVTSFSLWDS